MWTTSDDVLSAEISIMYRRLKAVIFLVRTVGLRDRSIDADIEVLNLLDAECSITQHTERDLKMSTHPQIIISIDKMSENACASAGAAHTSLASGSGHTFAT